MAHSVRNTMRKNINVPNVDIRLLRNQRDTVLEILEEPNPLVSAQDDENLKGLAHMLDEMVDIAEGYK